MGDAHAEHAPEGLVDPAVAWGTLGAHVVNARGAFGACGGGGVGVRSLSELAAGFGARDTAACLHGLHGALVHGSSSNAAGSADAGSAHCGSLRGARLCGISHAICCAAELAACGSPTSPRCCPRCPRPRPADTTYHAGCREPPYVRPKKRTRKRTRLRARLRARQAKRSTFSNGQARGRPVGVRAPKAALPHRRTYEWHGGRGADTSCRAQPRVQGAVVEQHRGPMHRAARRCAGAAGREEERPRCY